MIRGWEALIAPDVYPPPSQGVHMMFEGVPDRKWRADERRVNKMVFIGKDLNKEDFEEAFRGCLAVAKEVEVEVVV